MRVMPPVAILLLLSAAAVLSIGCDRNGDDLAPDGSSTGVADADVDGYRVIFRGVVNDTLTGRAQFGDVYDAQTQQISPIIELITASDFAGGLFIAPGGNSWPNTGRFSVGDGAGDTGEQFTLVYRQGLYRAFRSSSGSLSLSVVSDTLIRGSFDVVMTGSVAERGREPVDGEVEVSGSFSARPGQPGYIIGL